MKGDFTAERTVQRGRGSGGEGATREADHLFLVLEGARPLGGGARWDLTEVDEVVVRRGSSRSAQRATEGGKRQLVIKVPDGLLSSLHARIVRSPAGWRLVDE